MKEDGGFLGDRDLTYHQPLPLARLEGQLTSVGGLTNNWPVITLGFLGGRSTFSDGFLFDGLA